MLSSSSSSSSGSSHPSVVDKYLPVPFEDPPIASWGPEKILKRLAKEMDEMRDILASPKSHVLEKNTEDWFRCMGLSTCMSGALTTEILEAERLKEESLQTPRTMTIDDWRKHELPMALLLVMDLKFLYMDQHVLASLLENIENAAHVERKHGKELRIYKNEQARQFLHEIIDACPDLRFDDIKNAEADNRGSYFFLDEASRLYALLFLMELVVESSRHCDSIQDMRSCVKNKIDETDTPLTLPCASENAMIPERREELEVRFDRPVQAGSTPVQPRFCFKKKN